MLIHWDFFSPVSTRSIKSVRVCKCRLKFTPINPKIQVPVAEFLEFLEFLKHNAFCYGSWNLFLGWSLGAPEGKEAAYKEKLQSRISPRPE